jgi:lipoprotein NlpD
LVHSGQIHSQRHRCASGVVALLVAALLIGCGSRNRAPVEERAGGVRPPVPTTTAATPAPVPAPATPEVKPLPGAENAGKPGYYTVKPGDTLIRIGLETGQNWKDIVRWNNLENPNVVEVGQVLRVAPPGVDPSVASTRPVTVAKIDTKPLDNSRPATATPAPAVAPAPAALPAPSPPATPAGSSITAPSATRQGDDDVNWAWPATGTVLTSFDDARSKGLAIAGKVGDPVMAAADGRVVYAGSGLRGYGNLVIVKHNATYLTAYAHNQTLLVKEDQAVRRGQKIAEMGSTDADRVQLHFEIRKQGKPIDPARLLPPR